MLNQSFKRSVKKGLSRILYQSGLTGLILKRHGHRKSFILMYHRIRGRRTGSDLYSHSGMVVKEETFEFQMKYLKKNFQVVPLQDLVDGLKRESQDGQTKCSITFDDGWKDNFDYGLPILRKYGLPATIFLSTRYINSRNGFWQDRLVLLVDKMLRSENVLEVCKKLPNIISHRVRSLCKNMNDYRGRLDSIVESVKKIPDENRERLLDGLSNLIKDNRAGEDSCRLCLNWEEVREMRSKDISFGAHGATHKLLTELSHQEVQEEVLESKVEIEKHLNENVEGFCYPDGRYNGAIIAILRKHKFNYACTTRPGFNGPTTDPFQLRRIAVHNDISYTLPLFACRISGIL